MMVAADARLCRSASFRNACQSAPAVLRTSQLNRFEHTRNCLFMQNVAIQTRQPLFCPQACTHRAHSSHPLQGPSCCALCRCNIHISHAMQGRVQRAIKLQAASTTEVETQAKEEFYECILSKPLGVKFGRGNDGGCYVIYVDPKLGNIDERIEVGDKLVNVSASFGDDIWPAVREQHVVIHLNHVSLSCAGKLWTSCLCHPHACR